MGHLARFELGGKVVIVTGAGRGIGRTIALDAVRSGAKVAVGSRTVGELESLAAEIKSMDGECFHHHLDVVSVASIQAFFAAVIAHYGRIDGLVNNAGYNKQAPILDYGEELYDQIVDANLKNVFFCSQVAAKQFIAQSPLLFICHTHLPVRSSLLDAFRTFRHIITYRNKKENAGCNFSSQCASSGSEILKQSDK